MSKFRIVVHDQSSCHLFCDRGPVIGEHLVDRFSVDELSALAACVQAALAEQNSRVMGEQAPCSKCGGLGWYVEDVYDDANRFMGSFRQDGCGLCGLSVQRAQNTEH